jgi:threonine/homoserine/homoserine lactone efflux protein
MPSTSTLALFSIAAVALTIVPGPAVTYIVTQSVDKGRHASRVRGFATGGIFVMLGVTAAAAHRAS